MVVGLRKWGRNAKFFLESFPDICWHWSMILTLEIASWFKKTELGREKRVTVQMQLPLQSSLPRCTKGQVCQGPLTGTATRDRAFPACILGVLTKLVSGSPALVLSEQPRGWSQTQTLLLLQSVSRWLFKVENTRCQQSSSLSRTRHSLKLIQLFLAGGTATDLWGFISSTQSYLGLAAARCFFPVFDFGLVRLCKQSAACSVQTSGSENALTYSPRGTARHLYRGEATYTFLPSPGVWSSIFKCFFFLVLRAALACQQYY